MENISEDGKLRKRANGQGSVNFDKRRGKWRARWTVQTARGPKREEAYANSETEAEALIYKGLGRWEEYQRVLDMIDETAATHVYFIQCVAGGPIKIGTAQDVDNRLKAIQACCPYPLRVLHVIQGASQAVEAKLHKRFAALRLHGEWFDANSELLTYIHKLTVGQDKRRKRAKDAQHRRELYEFMESYRERNKSINLSNAPDGGQRHVMPRSTSDSN